ncbi:MAG: tetratricopeptide repeat protein [Okeania sp. SIO3H1]|nr:tetratricopeptide repeat protein [Okeania sp. SIO3H1]
MVQTNFKTANQLLREGKLDDAVAAYREAIALNPGFSHGHHNLGEALVKVGQIEEAITAFRQAVAINPQASWSLYKLGVLLQSEGQFQEAVGYFRQAVEQKTDVPEFYLGLGAVLVKLRQWSEAEQCLDKVLNMLYANVGKFHGTSLQTEADYYLGAAKSGQQQWSEAVEFYRRSWEMSPGGVDCCLGLAEALGKLGQWSEAVEFYRQAVVLSGESGEVLFGLGQALGQLGRWEEAVVEYQRAISLGFAGAEVRHHLGYALGQLGRWEEAVVEYRLVVEVSPKSAVVRHQLGYALMRLERWREAVVELRKSVELHPRSAVIWQQLGDVLSELGNRDETVEVYRKALEIEHNFDVEEKLVALLQGKTKKSLPVSLSKTQNQFSPPSTLWEEQQQLGIKLQEEGKLDEAAASYRRAITLKSDKLQFYYQALETNPQDYLIYLNLGNALVEQEMFDHAIVFYKRGLKIKPDNLDMNLQLGKILAQQNKWERASIYFSRAVEIDSECFECQQSLAEAQKNTGQIEAAIVSYQNALKIKPHDYLLINKLGDLLEKKGKLEEALSYYRRVLEVSYSSPNLVNKNPLQVFNNRVLLPLHLSLPYEQTGYAIRSHSILTSLKEKGIDVLATTRLGYPSSFLPQYQNKSVPEIEEIDSIRYLRLNSEEKQTDIEQNYAYIEGYAERLVKAAMSHNASVIHSASNFENGMATVLAARRAGIKSVYEVRGFWHLSRVAKLPKFRDSYWFTYYQSMESAVVRQVDAVVALSQVMKDKLIDWGVDSRKITIVPNAVDTNKFKPRSPDDALQRKWGLNSQFVVGFIGSLNEYEGVDLLIKAVAGLVDGSANIKLLVVGDGSGKKGLEKLVKSVNMNQHIIFTGQVPFSDVIDYYALSNVCVFPRKAEEVCQYVPPLKLLEPMAMAKPVIVSALPPLMEMVKHEETGLVSRSDDIGSLQSALLRIYNSPGLGDRLGKTARDWIKANRQWSVVSQKYLEVYQKLFSRVC